MILLQSSHTFHFLNLPVSPKSKHVGDITTITASKGHLDHILNAVELSEEDDFEEQVDSYPYVEDHRDFLGVVVLDHHEACEEEVTQDRCAVEIRNAW